MSVAEDIIGIKKALEGEWEAIIATQGQVELFLSDGLTWLKTNEDTFWTDFESAAEHFISGIKALHVGDFDTSIENVASIIKSDIDPILTQLESIGDDLNPAKAIDSLLGNFPTFPGVPNMPKIPGLNTAAFQTVFNEILDLESDFSFAIKPLKPPPPPPGGHGPNAAESQELVSLLFSAFETELEGFFTASITGDLETMKTSLEGLITDDVISSLKANLATVIENLKDAEKLTTDLILAQLKDFLESELDSAVSISTTLVTNMKTDLAKVRSIFDGLANLTADAGSDFTKFYQEVFDSEDPPTLLEAVSFVIAIPLTLTSQATTGQNFAFPQSAFLSFDGTAKTWMTGILQILDVVIAIGDKAYSYYKESHPPSIDYKYKILMGCISSVKSALFQVAFLPKHLSITNHYKDNLLWYLGWGTGFGFSLVKWLIGAYMTKENKTVDDAKVLQNEVILFYNTFQSTLTTLNNAYDKIKNTYSDEFTKDATSYETEIQAISTKLLALKAGIKTIPSTTSAFQIYLDQLKNTHYNGETMKVELSRMTNAIQNKLSPKKRKAEKDNITAINESKNKLEELQVEFDSLKHFAGTVSPDAGNAGHNATVGDKFLNEICPMIDVIINMGTLGFKIFVYNTKKGQDESTLVNAIVGSSLSIVSDLHGLYYYFNKPAGGSNDEKVKNLSSDYIFLLGELWEIKLAAFNLDMVAKLDEIDYYPDQKTLKVSFNYDVYQDNAPVPGNFVLKLLETPINIASVTSGDDSSFTLTLTDSLAIGDYTLAVTHDLFTDPWGKPVVASKSFNVPAGISSATYDATTTEIKVTFNTSLTLKGTLDSCFTLSPITSIKSIATGEDNSYTITLKSALGSGQYNLRTATGAFDDAGGQAVVSIFSFEVPSNPST